MADVIFVNRTEIDGEIYKALTARRHAVPGTAQNHWRLELEENFEATMARHSSKHRKRLRWELRKLAEIFDGDLEFQTVTRPGELEAALLEAEAVSGRTYHRKVGGMVRASKDWIAQLSDAAEQGNLRLYFLKGGGDVIAFVVAVKEFSALHVMAMAFLPEYSQYSPGKHLLLHAIEESCGDGIKWVDYGFGDAEYKRVYGTEVIKEAHLYLYGVSLKSRLAWLMDCSISTTDRRLRRILSSGAIRQFKNQWRRLLAR